MTKAVHFADGNLFDDLRINVNESIHRQEVWLEKVQKLEPRRSLLGNAFRRIYATFLNRIGLRSFLVNQGFINEWFLEFLNYWNHCLDGRPIDLLDFHMLRFNYRKKFQSLEIRPWKGTEAHLANWQHPQNIHSIFYFVHRYALDPSRGMSVFPLISRNSRVLEYGCAIAPSYRTYREYFNHKRLSWVLADIATFPFHYARHCYARDPDVQFQLIRENMFADPLRKVEGIFDVMFVNEVFEHLDHPLAIAEYLLERLRPGGLFLFDYVLSDAEGLDTPGGLMERSATLSFLRKRLDVIEGAILDGSETSVAQCICRKR